MSETEALTECIASWCANEDWCGVACAMDAIGRKWHPVIVHRLLRDGPLGFGDLARDLDVTNKVLSESLADLEKKGLVEREVVADRPVRVSYSLTDRGLSLEPVIDALEAWGDSYARDRSC